MPAQQRIQRRIQRPRPAVGRARAQRGAERGAPARSASRSLRGRLGALVAFALYLLGAFILTAGAWRDPASGWAGVCCDQEQAIWFLGWTPHALANGLDPFFTTQIGAPDGVNLMWNTGMPVLGLLGWLPSLIGGPIFAFNVLLVLSVAFSAFTAWLAIRRWTGDGLGALVGGAVYAFAPYVASHAAVHLNLTAAWVPPLLLLVLDELLLTRRRPAWQAGVALGVLSAIQLLITEEYLAMSVLVAGLLVLVLAVARRDGAAGSRVREAAPRVAVALAVAAVTFIVLAAWPLAAQFLGPQRITSQVQSPEQFSTDLLNLVVPTPYQLVAPDAITGLSRRFSTLYHEATAYLGLPLLVLLVGVAVRRWNDLRVRIASVMAGATFVLSLGPWLHIGTQKLVIPLPWLPFEALPLLEHILPGRFTLFMWLAIATLVAVFIADATSRVDGEAVPRLVAIGVALLLILPAPLARWPFETPAFFRSWASQGIGSDDTVLVAPYFRNGALAAPMIWAAVAGYGPRMTEAYAYMPWPDGKTGSGPPFTQLSTIMERIQDDQSPLVARGNVRDRVASDLTAAGIRHVIVGPMEARDAMLTFFEDLFGRAPEEVGGVSVWRDVDVHGVAPAPAGQ